MHRTTLIFNDAADDVRDLKAEVRRNVSWKSCRLQATEGPGDARRLAREALADGAERLIVAGGDGTISDAIAGLADDLSAVELAVVPLGTGNDFARSLGIPLSLKPALEVAFENAPRRVDLVRLVNHRTPYLVNVASGGFGGKVAADVLPSEKKTWGSFAYWLTAMREIVDLRPTDVQLDFDGDSLRLSAYGVFVANGQFVGGGFPIAPRSRLDDGLLDVIVVPDMPTVEILAAGVNWMLGVSDHRVESFQTPSVRISASPALPFSVDGELTNEMDAQFEVIPQALRVVTGSRPPALDERKERRSR